MMAATIKVTNVQEASSSNYLSIQDIIVLPLTSTWYAGANSTDVSGNNEWLF
jgi:hypothetical protein